MASRLYGSIKQICWVLPPNLQAPCLKSFFSTSTAASSPSSVKIGFVGTGNMGGPMASNLLKYGEKVVVYDSEKEKLAPLVAQGATAASSLKELGSQSQVVVTILPGPDNARAVYLGPDGLFNNSPKNTFFIDSSTIGPVAARELSDAAYEAGHKMIDAPVSGFVLGAINGTLTFMVGGSEKLFHESMPLLQKMGKKIYYCGGNGNGQVVKICNNLILGITMQGVSEATRLAESLGVDAKTLFDVVNSSSGSCWSSTVYNPVPGICPDAPASKGYLGGFSLDLMLKDLHLAALAAKEERLSLPVGNKSIETYEKTKSLGLGKTDFSCVYKHYV